MGEGGRPAVGTPNGRGLRGGRGRGRQRNTRSQDVQVASRHPRTSSHALHCFCQELLAHLCGPKDLKILSCALSLPVFVAGGWAFAAQPLPVFVAGSWVFVAQPFPVFVARDGPPSPCLFQPSLLGPGVLQKYLPKFRLSVLKVHAVFSAGANMCIPITSG